VSEWTAVNGLARHTITSSKATQPELRGLSRSSTDVSLVEIVTRPAAIIVGKKPSQGSRTTVRDQPLFKVHSQAPKGPTYGQVGLSPSLSGMQHQKDPKQQVVLAVYIPPAVSAQSE
jgi:hypothetical protein